MKARTLLALVLAVSLAPAAAAAPPKRAPAKRSATAGSPLPGLSAGGFVGYEADDLAGLALRLDGELPLQALGPQLDLSGIGSLGYSRLSDDRGGGVDFVANVLKVVPAARVSFPLNPQLTLFADGGLGLYYASWELDYPPGVPFDVDDSEISVLMRLGVGAWYHANEQTRIGGILEFDPYFGDLDQTTFILAVGAMFLL